MKCWYFACWLLYINWFINDSETFTPTHLHALFSFFLYCLHTCWSGEHFVHNWCSLFYHSAYVCTSNSTGSWIHYLTPDFTALFLLASGAANESENMSTTALTDERRTPLINVTQVSIDGQEHDVPMRPKKTQNNNSSTLAIKSTEVDTPAKDSTPKSSIARRYVFICKWAQLFSTFWHR